MVEEGQKSGVASGIYPPVTMKPSPLGPMFRWPAVAQRGVVVGFSDPMSSCGAGAPVKMTRKSYGAYSLRYHELLARISHQPF